jgi:hypothetical protein
MRTVVLKLTVLLSAFVCLPARTDGCTCGQNPPPCLAFQTTPVVFVGLVKSISEEKVDIIRFGKKETIRVGLTAHFVVEEALKGISVSEVDVATGGGGGDCGYNFEAGKRYLVYAHRSEGEALSSAASRTVFGGGSKSTKQNTLAATICSRTSPLSDALDDLDLIRALKAGKPQTRIFGTVSEFVQGMQKYGFNLRNVGPMADVIIKVQGTRGSFETRTDSQGHYRIVGVPPGKYNVKAQLPKDYGPLFDFDRNPVPVEVSSQGCSAEADFDAQVDGRIEGQIFDADGKPVADQVGISITTPEMAAKALPINESRFEYTKKQGRYRFDGVQPGRYVLGVSVCESPTKHTPYTRTYYPTGDNLSQAAILNVAKGQKLLNLDLRLPPRLTEQTITGVVLLEDGKPAAGATISIYDSEDLQTAIFGFDAKSDAQGRLLSNP